FGEKETKYITAVVEHIPNNILVPTNYSHRLNVNVSFNGLVYNVYVRNVQNKCFIGLKLKSGQNSIAKDSSQNFAAAIQFFANELNTNAVLREELNRVTNIGISSEGVVMIDFIDFPQGATTQESIQKLYRPGDIMSGLVGVYSVQDLSITPESLTTIQQDIKAVKIYKLNQVDQFYKIDLNLQRLSDLDFIEKAIEIKKKEGATTIILNFVDFDFNTIIHDTTQDNLKMITFLAHSFDLRTTIQIDITKTTNYENLLQTLFELGFDGISIDASGSKDIQVIRTILNLLEKVSKENSVIERNTILLNNKQIKDQLGDLDEYNVLVIESVNQETSLVTMGKGQKLEAKDRGYQRGCKILEQNIDTTTTNIRDLLNLLQQKSSSISSKEIKDIVQKAGITYIVQKHIEIILSQSYDKASNNEDVAVLEAIGFLRGFIESYVLNQYLKAFGLPLEIFNMNEYDIRKALIILLTTLLITDTENKIFKSSATLKTFFEQAKTALEEYTPLNDTAVLSLKNQMIVFTKDIIEKFDEDENINSIIRTSNSTNPYNNLYIYIALASNLINVTSYRKSLDKLGKRTKTFF
ncbi:MAG: hypothetical protein LBD41_07050, partial [Clostridiales Family XIII bacterium]|nr:hypothetical protein [Clostridiales Family XIII bacterium]